MVFTYHMTHDDSKLKYVIVRIKRKKVIRGLEKMVIGDIFGVNCS